MFAGTQTQRNLQVIRAHGQCRFCEKSNDGLLLEMPCECVEAHGHIHEQCAKQWLQDAFIITPRKIKEDREESEQLQRLDNNQENGRFVMECQHCHHDIVFDAGYYKKFISLHDRQFNYIYCELICYVVTILISLAIIAVISYVIVRFFRQSSNSVVSIVIAFIIIAILTVGVIRLAVQLFKTFRVKKLERFKFIYSDRRQAPIKITGNEINNAEGSEKKEKQIVEGRSDEKSKQSNINTKSKSTTAIRSDFLVDKLSKDPKQQ